MLYVNDALILDWDKVDAKYNFTDFFNKKQFTVADTPLSYRQVNTLDVDGLIPDARKNKKGWRKFNIKELIYVTLVDEIKKFGLDHEKLKLLYDSFFAEIKESEYMQDVATDIINRGLSETAIGCVLGGVEITLVVYEDGSFAYFDPVHYLLLKDDIPALHLQLNKYVNQIFRRVGKDIVRIKTSIRSLYLDEMDILSIKEKELLKILRSDKYSAIRVRKKDGEISIVNAETVNNKNEGLTSQELIEIIKGKKYQDISVIKRDGVIVNCKVEETIKLGEKS